MFKELSRLILVDILFAKLLHVVNFFLLFKLYQIALPGADEIWTGLLLVPSIHFTVLQEEWLRSRFSKSYDPAEVPIHRDAWLNRVFVVLFATTVVGCLLANAVQPEKDPPPPVRPAKRLNEKSRIPPETQRFINKELQKRRKDRAEGKMQEPRRHGGAER